ncbi:MAG: hypothetical protein A2Y10_01090 [Planctomycetes bacterium GWF2_41_51]|nr:MAG: hypothetical protein A2Y10_01090 [Planctomycetes bacterium GWF2_41_51]HBG26541.1 hypothetical protein [Phycisphaerales bacterium]
MTANLGVIDISMLILYALICVGMGVYYFRKTRTSEQFMLAGQSIPAWAAGIAVMSAYVSSISYIAVPGQAFDTNWHPAVFVLCIPPIVWLVCWYIIPYYRRIKLVSVYSLLENSLGKWARIYSALSFVVYMIGRSAVIIYLTALLVGTFIPINIVTLIIIIGLITVFYTLVGGMEAVIWTDVMQSIIMIGGLLFCVILFTKYLFTGPEYPIKLAAEAGKFSLGSLDFSFSSRTIWVMIIYSLTENLRNLIADQNYVQKYSTVSDERSAKKAIIISMAIYIPMTPVFLYIGTSLFAFYHTGGNVLPDTITKGDQVFPYFIATQLPVGLKGLIIAAIIAAAMSTLSSSLNSSATVLLLDFIKWMKPDLSEKKSLSFLRWTTVVWGGLSIIFAVLMIRAQSALNIWWQISGIFGGGILGLFILALCKVKLKSWQGITAVAASILVISWVTFFRSLPENWKWAQCNIDSILAGACGVGILILVGFILVFSGGAAMNTEQKKQLHKDFWQSKTSCLIFIPSAQMVQYDTDNYEQRFYDPQKMWDAECKRATAVLDWPTDGIPAIRPNLGTIFIPSIAGQDFVIRDGQMPWPGEHLSIEQISEIRNIDIGSTQVMNLAEKFYEINNKKGSRQICTYMPDTQGVFDILHLLLGDAIFYELADKKEKIKELLHIITEFYVKVSLKLKKCMGEDAGSMFHGHGTQQGLYFPNAGVRLSEDTPTLLSPSMIDEFVIPYMRQAAKPFGGAFVHFCGKHDYLYDKILECDFVKAIDLGNPEMYDTHHLLDKCAKTNTIFYGKLANMEKESWKQYLTRIANIIKDTGAKCVLRPTVFPDSIDECKKMYDIWHELTK